MFIGVVFVYWISISETDLYLFFTLQILYQDNKFVSPYGLGWHRYIKAARDRHEQNLDLCRQSNNTICFRTLRYIVKGEQLLVWYDTPLALELNIPIITIQHIKGRFEEELAM